MPGTTQIIIVAVLVILLFGRGKIAGLMGEVAKGITSFRKGMKEGSDSLKEDPKKLSDDGDAPVVDNVVDTTAKETTKDKAEP